MDAPDERIHFDEHGRAYVLRGEPGPEVIFLDRGRVILRKGETIIPPSLIPPALVRNLVAEIDKQCDG